MNPTDLARERWKPYRSAVEGVERATGVPADARARVEALTEQVAAGERGDDAE